MAPPKILGDCTVPGCGKAATGRGYCNKHYQLWYRHGRPEHPAYHDQLRRRFEKKVSKDASGCWIWIGSLAHFGHGRVSIRGKLRHAHRVAWELYRGPIPAGMVVCHHCDVPACVNPDHLFLGSHADNFNDMRAKRRHAFGERNGQSKLREDDVRGIRSDSRSNVEIAREYGVSNVLVSKIKRREAWAHVA